MVELSLFVGRDLGGNRNEDAVCWGMVEAVCPIFCEFSVRFMPGISIERIFQNTQEYPACIFIPSNQPTAISATIVADCFLTIWMQQLYQMQSHANNNTADESIRPLRFTFIQKFRNDARAQFTPSLQPIINSNLHTISTSSSRPSQQDSARSILKRTIIREQQAITHDRKDDSFMMKGKMLNGIKKPLQNQMASLLQGINERIIKQSQKSEKSILLDLPIITRDKGQKDEEGEFTRFKYNDIFKKINELRSRKTTDQLRVIIKPKTRRNSDLTPPIRKTNIQPPANVFTIQTAHNNTPQTERRTSKDSPVKTPVLPLKKGYLSYDESAKLFLQQNRPNSEKSYELSSQKNRQLTAKHFMIVDCSNMTPMVGRGCDESIQVASISKVMTCYLCLLVCKKYQVDIYTQQVRVSDRAAQTPGTTAELQSGDLLTIYDLLHGLMLPSGNDASVALAESMGKIIQRYKQKQTKKSHYQTFIAHMNLLAREMNLPQNWNNSSGLSTSPNYTTPRAMAILSSVALKDELFRQIVNTKRYEVEVKNDRYGLTRKLIWKNTNKLLECGWEGVKTGTTDTAGHCLMALKGTMLIAVYSCDTLARRFSQCVYLQEKYSSFIE